MTRLSRRSFVGSGGAASFALVAATPSLSQVAAADEASVAVRLLTRYHPGLLRYLDAEQWAETANRFAQGWRADPSLEARYLQLSRLTAAIRCSHTHCNPYNQAETIDRLLGGRRLLPFRFDWLGERMAVNADPHETGLAPGTEILAIDDAPVGRLLAHLMTLTRADGALDNKRRALLSVTGAKYETFDLFTAASGTFRGAVTLAVRAPDGTKRTTQVPTIDIAARRAAIEETEAEEGPLWSSREEDGATVLTMPTWAVFNSDWDWKRWLVTFFAGLDTNRLVIDLRGNEGGLDACGAALMAHLVTSPVELPRSRSLTRVSTVAEEDRPYLETWDESFFTIGESFAVAGPGYRVVPEDFPGAIMPAAKPYRGRVAVIVGADNSSATGIFAELTKSVGAATLVGQETGRNRRGGNGGAFFFARLPESGLEFDIPLVGGFMPGDPPNAGTMPDVAVERTPASIASGEDLELAAAFAAIA